ncbi:Outer membrane receptor proteins, mostly Fe transport [Novosphingobium sp. CF614]|uniref:TonB-dependent receptor n=1 Tax=Novosphingobium sp. CF614 TaxID=1884364 RepID=UPI0008E23FE6|nr:TonB-dependent receptor [Novosphingobium sp. CF614]SFG13742.1 Outer membrane receptor proteins, mostly Fe transport [Novosphingobium sp. CF614]
MNARTIRSTLFCGSAILSALVYAPAAVAQADADSIDNTGDIIVTARRVEERLQDVPISIAVYNQEQLDARNVTTINDVAAFTPSLSTNPRFGTENTSFSIRGFTQDTFTAASVAVYFAEAGALRGSTAQTTGEGAGPGSFFDLQNIQVLKGPQGTLFGRNTTGGAILLVPKRPESEFGGYVMGSYGNYDMTRLQAVLNIPVGEGGLRLGFDRMKRDGYQKNIGVGPSRLADTDYVAARLSFLAPLTDNLENYTVLTYSRSKTAGTLARVTDCLSTATLGNIPAGKLSCDQVDRLNATGDFYAVESATAEPLSYARQWQAINTTTWNVSDSLTVKNIVTYGELANRFRADAQGASWVIRADDPVAGANGTNGNFTGLRLGFALVNPAHGVDNNNQATFTEELQLQGNFMDGRLHWILGGYYEKSFNLGAPTGAFTSVFVSCSGDQVSTCVSPYRATGSITESVRKLTLKGLGIFSQTTYEFTDKWSVTAGIRYTEDRSASIDRNFTYRLTPALSTSCSSADTTLPTCTGLTKAKSSAPTWLINLSYKPGTDAMLYAKYARGYRQGLVNPRALFPYKSFGPEKLDSYEAGAKLNWHGSAPGYVNAAAFYNDFNNQQFVVTWADANGRTFSGIVNSAKSVGYGVELDTGIDLFHRLRLSGAVTYLHTELKDVFVPPQGPPGFPNPVPTAGNGDPSPIAPKWKGAASARYTLPIPEELGEISAAVSWQYTDSYMSTTRQTSGVDSFDTFNLNFDWKDIGGKPIDLGLFVNNVTKEKYYVFVNDLLSRGFLSKITGQPRMYGMQLKVRFGSEAR